MRLYYHQTDGGAEYYCLDNVAHTHQDNDYFKDCTEEGDMTTWILRTDGNELEVNTDNLKVNNIKLVIRG